MGVLKYLLSRIDTGEEEDGLRSDSGGTDPVAERSALEKMAIERAINELKSVQTLAERRETGPNERRFGLPDTRMPGSPEGRRSGTADRRSPGFGKRVRPN